MSENRKFDNVTKLIHILVRFFEKKVIIPVILSALCFGWVLLIRNTGVLSFLVFLQYGLLMY